MTPTPAHDHTDTTRRYHTARAASDRNDVGRYARQLIAEVHALAGDSWANRTVAEFRDAVVEWLGETTG